MADVAIRLLRHIPQIDGRLVTAGDLARAAGVSTRTIYRDVVKLRAAGIDLRGSAGIGYLLKKPGGRRG